MALKILVVDDSLFFQRRLVEIINEHPQLEVIGVANNGQEAIDKVKLLSPDLVTMDYEMPLMDGVTAVRAIMADNPLPILMLSSMTFPGAKITIDALDAGAVDFVTKNFSDISNKSQSIKIHLHRILLALGEGILNQANQRSSTSLSPHNSTTHHSIEQHVKTGAAKHPRATTTINYSINKKAFKVVAIGASTGGPAALTELLKKIPASFPLPILIVQHMPANFTQVFANRLNLQCAIKVKQAVDGDPLVAGIALLAPGGKQMIIDKNNIRQVKVMESAQNINYKPSVDISFASLSNTYGTSTLGIVLTGMGSDGCNGARLLKEQHSTIWTQNKESCVVYGMPMAIDKSDLSDASLSLGDIGNQLAKLTV